MPKVVDAAERRQLIFDAVFDVVVEHGVEQASLRRVADAAGLAIGSVRHYFDSQQALLTGAADEIVARLAARLERHRAKLGTGTQEERDHVVRDMFCELLPLTPATSREVTVWLEVLSSARTNPVLRDAAARLLDGSLQLARIIAAHRATPGRVEVEAQRLAALLDGLAMRGVLGGEGLGARTSRDVLRAHLATLASARG